MEGKRMNYTIASLDDVHNDQQLELSTNGNQYVVTLYHKETRESTRQSYYEMSGAYQLFEKLAHCICFGEYGYADRKKMFK